MKPRNKVLRPTDRLVRKAFPKVEHDRYSWTQSYSICRKYRLDYWKKFDRQELYIRGSRGFEYCTNLSKQELADFIRRNFTNLHFLLWGSE